MKPYALFACLAVLTIISCHHDKKKNNTTSAQPAHFKPLFTYGDTRLLDYDRYLAGLDTQKVQLGGVAFQKFKSIFAGLPPGVCDTAYVIFESFHVRLVQGVEAKLGRDSVYLEPLAPEAPGQPATHLTPKQSRIKQELAANGIAFGEDEGETFLVENYPMMARQWASYVSPAMKAWLDQMAREQKEGFQDDAALTITPQQLAERTVFWEQYEQTYPHFLKTEGAADERQLLLYVLVTGMDNTELSESDSLTDYYKTAYQYLGEHWANSKINGVIAPYAKAWQAHDTTEINRIKDLYKR
jgi:hypothetical protein